MALVLFDTNILVDALKNYPEALDEIAHWDEPAISAITWMEIYAGAKPEEMSAIDIFIRGVGFEVIHTDDEIARGAAQIRGDSIRKGPKIALPDAIIMATAQVRNLTIITRNKRDFRGTNVRVPYELVQGEGRNVKVVNVAPRTALSVPNAQPGKKVIMRWTEKGWEPMPESRGPVIIRSRGGTFIVSRPKPKLPHG